MGRHPPWHADATVEWAAVVDVDGEATVEDPVQMAVEDHDTACRRMEHGKRPQHGEEEMARAPRQHRKVVSRAPQRRKVPDCKHGLTCHSGNAELRHNRCHTGTA